MPVLDRFEVLAELSIVLHARGSLEPRTEELKHGSPNVEHACPLHVFHIGNGTKLAENLHYNTHSLSTLNTELPCTGAVQTTRAVSPLGRRFATLWPSWLWLLRPPLLLNRPLDVCVLLVLHLQLWGLYAAHQVCALCMQSTTYVQQFVVHNK